MLHRVGFYPCCGGDIKEPLELLSSYVDEIIFCDLKVRRPKSDSIPYGLGPKATFIRRDVIDYIEHMPTISVLFYRADSGGIYWSEIKKLREMSLPTDHVVGEGGSGIEIMGDVLPSILKKFHPSGGWIFSDGSNSDKQFDSLIRIPNEWQNRPMTGFKFRYEPDFSFENTGRGRIVYAIRVLPIHSSASVESPQV
jgi:hypothetical protein